MRADKGDSVEHPRRSSIGIIATGACLPERRVPNAEIAATLQVDERWIARRTGVHERRFVDDDATNRGIAHAAARQAIDRAGVDPADLAGVVVATSTPDRPIPPVAPYVQAMLGAASAFAFDVNAACAGFLYSLEIARGLLGGVEGERHVVVIGSDTYSRLLNPADRGTYTLFGDGAGAVLLGPVEAGAGILGGSLHADGNLSEIAVGGPRLPISPAQIEHGEHLAGMVGHKVAATMRTVFPVLVKDALAKHCLTIDDIDHLVCHQANPNLVRECARDAGFAPEQVVITGDRYGNTAAASVPIGLDAATADGRIRHGSLVLMVSFGAGMTWAWSLVRWVGPVR
ncbi:3-oxoacyl-ACP synthase III family protein [Actinokineospora guangxiensis]|uniref:3-oxoacyl-ACP synthase III family protein n=1 Tax=Actinokineospora guangxiensis TaxID=1490288 RepID=A0ABW0EV92_9PSEU